MKMTWRWFGEGNDNISLDEIKQIPGVDGIAWSLHDMTAGNAWDSSRIKAETELIKRNGFNADVVESVNIHDSIKIGSPERDKYIDIYIDTIEKLADAGVKVICYNFMPVFDWIRTDLYKGLADGSNAMYYEKSRAEVSHENLINEILKKSDSFTMPGWEPERLKHIQELFNAYSDVDEEKLTENCKYFLERIIPACEKNDVRMAIHPDDPPWPMYGLPRIVRSFEHIKRFLKLVDSPYNGLTLCTGSLGANPDNDIPAMIREFGPRIHFAHVRNLKRDESGNFIETSHKSSDGDLNIAEIIKALMESTDGAYIRPDHGRHLWGEEKNCRPGYGLYDRGFGVMYLHGLMDAFREDRK